MIRSLLFLASLLPLLPATGWGRQQLPWDQRMARTVMTLWPEPGPGREPFPKWSYDEGVILKGMEQLWLNTGNGTYFRYIQRQMDHFVTPDGRIPRYRQEGYRLDDINNGKVLLTLYRVTGQRKYWQAATLLRQQLDSQPRTPDGGFWHKKIYPQQMWLDGLYMAEPFFAEYAMLAHQDSVFPEVTRQFRLMEQHSRDTVSGLLYHGWDASRRQRWADPVTGRSPHFWGRAMGWYAMALVDALDYFPAAHPDRDTLKAILGRLAEAVAVYQDTASGCWYQVLDSARAPGNYLEASAACMFVYALAKGARKGYLPARFHDVAAQGFAGILKTFVTPGTDGGIDLHGTCSVAGLGGDPYRDGSYAYYLSEKVVTNDPKGVGAFLLAAGEMRHLSPDGVTVLLDHYFNDENRDEAAGTNRPFHYLWSDRSDGGFSLWGHLFRLRGAGTALLDTAPSPANLQGAGIYILADPDTRAENPASRRPDTDIVKTLRNWVKEGGVLVLMGNDSGNCSFTSLHTLASPFGINFLGDSHNRVKGRHFEQGALDIPPGSPVFPFPGPLYMKELSAISLGGGAKPLLRTRDGAVAAAVSRYGKGVVLAVGDPWLYNEYTDGRKLPPEFHNFAAAGALTDWLLGQTGTPAKP